MITSTQNPKIKYIHALQNGQKERKADKVFVVEGAKMIMEAPKKWIKEVIVSKTYYESVAVADLGNIPYEVVSDSVFKHISTSVTPQGILGVLSQQSLAFEELIKKPLSFVIAVENLQDPGNLGTILRTADAAGVDAVLLSKGCVDLYNPKVVRATMGSIYRVPVITNISLTDALPSIKEIGIPVYAAHLKTDNYYDSLDYRKAACFLIGNEGKGLSDEVSKLATDYVKIPIIGQAESLNASIAAAILMYEVVRQRRVE